MKYRVIAKSKTSQNAVVELSRLGKIKAHLKARILRAKWPGYDLEVVPDMLALHSK